MRIKVAHLSYSVLPITPANIAEHGEIVGLCDHYVPAIYIEPTQPAAEQARTLFHELLHAFFHAHNIKGKRFDEERVCEVLESPLTMLILDNPGLHKAIRDALLHGKPLV